MPRPTRRQLPHPPDVALRRRAKQAAVLAVELGDAFVADARCRAARVQRVVQHQLPRLLQAQLLLVLHRAHAGQAAKVLAKRRGALCALAASSSISTSRAKFCFTARPLLGRFAGWASPLPADAAGRGHARRTAAAVLSAAQWRSPTPQGSGTSMTRRR